MTPATSSRKSCFVIAPYQVQVGSFLEALRTQNVEPFFISDFLKSGSFAISSLRSAFKSVDLVIALLIPGHILDNVIFEIGLAVGMSRPLLVFAERGLKLPSDLRGLRVNFVDLSALVNTIPEIQKFLEPKLKSEFVASRYDSLGPPDRARPRLKGPALSDELRRLRSAIVHRPSAAQLESDLSRLLTVVGWTVAEARSSAKTRAPDLAVWIDEIQKDVGNPLAVEVKTSLSPQELARAVEQLSHYVTSSGAKAGILLYGGPEIPLERNVAQRFPPIFAFTLEQLADLLEQEKFPAALKASSAAARRMA
jgi:hypothetical protein